MTERMEILYSLKFIHLIIGVILLLLLICLHIGLRPLCLIGNFGLIALLVDYKMYPYRFELILQALNQWLPVLFELSLFYGSLNITYFLNLSQPWHTILIILCIIRSTIIVYYRLLPIDDIHRQYIEKIFENFYNFLLDKSRSIFDRLIKIFNTTTNDDYEIEKFQKLEELKSIDNIINEHDETIQRFQQISTITDLSSPIIGTTIEKTTTSIDTPPTRRHHTRILHQDNEFEAPSRTPITPAHPSSSSFHTEIDRSYTGPVTRNRSRTNTNVLRTSPIKSKQQQTQFTLLVCKRHQE